MLKRLSVILIPALLALGCAPDDVGDGRDDSFADGKGDGLVEPGSPEARAVLALVNDPTTDIDTLDNEARLSTTAAFEIMAHRRGPDDVDGTDDDDLFDDLAELDSVPFVGPVALQRLLDLARARGLLQGRALEAIFSPQPADTSHNQRLIELIEGATESIDIAIYSFSQAGISDALENAVADGVKVRFIFETAKSNDKKLTGDALQNSKSGRLERAGVDVRYVNKIMHHKFMIVDGPRDDLAAASTARIASGSGNWNVGATQFDENTMFLTGNAEAALRMQREFNLMWDNSQDLIANDELEFDQSRAAITDADIPDDPDFDIIFTSANFDVSNQSFRTARRDSVSDVLVEAIENAEESIHIASGHLRLRPVSEALMARAGDGLDIRVYLDGQEYISSTSNDFQEADLEECLAEATTDTQTRNCLAKGFLFGFVVGDTPGIEVRYKYYAYRWNHSYAVQMHHKYMIIDGTDLYSGSYNFSDNAEHDTFENVFILRGGAYQDLIDQYEANFEALWETNRAAGLLDALLDAVTSGDSFDIVFTPMALVHEEVRNLKATMLRECPEVNSSEFRTNPGGHRTCNP